MQVIERNLQGIGDSLLVTLPKPWTRLLKLKKGSKIKMMVSGRGAISIMPEFVAEKKEEESIILYDENFARRFFREYFQGYEKITIRFNKEALEAKKKEVYHFLKRFMNLQIIEEVQDKVVVKCFKIDDLSIEECLQRMYFLSLNMLEELAGKNNKAEMQEMEEALTRFYYMLVMQTRRYLSEGKFAEANQIPLLRAVDCRSVAEKIERIGDVVKKFETLQRKELKELLGKVKAYYRGAGSYFTHPNYEKALSLWHEERRLQERYEKVRQDLWKKKNIAEHQQLTDLFQILHYAKEISMLVR